MCILSCMLSLLCVCVQKTRLLGGKLDLSASCLVPEITGF